MVMGVMEGMAAMRVLTDFIGDAFVTTSAMSLAQTSVQDILVNEGFIVKYAFFNDGSSDLAVGIRGSQFLRSSIDLLHKSESNGSHMAIFDFLGL